MAEYIEREALLADIAAAVDHGGMGRVVGQTLVRYAKRIPAADVAPVVRCKDCKHIRPEVDAYTGETIGYWCEELDIGSIDVDDFCSRGERKETGGA